MQRLEALIHGDTLGPHRSEEALSRSSKAGRVELQAKLVVARLRVIELIDEGRHSGNFTQMFGQKADVLCTHPISGIELLELRK